MRLRRFAALAAPAALLSIVLVGAAGAADPSFTPSGVLPAGSNPFSLAVADVNGDGNRDLAVANEGSDDVAILLGNGSGGFAAASGSPVKAGDAPFAVETADLNGDGRADLVLANSMSNDVTVLLGDGAGAFSEAPGSPIALRGSARDVVAADLSGDGKVDLAVPFSLGGWRVAVLLGDGTGRFSPAPESPIGLGGSSGSARVAAADVDVDGRQDLIVARSESRVLAIMLGLGGGRFGAARTIAAGYGPSSIAVADLNRDRKPDLAVGTLYSDSGRSQPKLTILLGNGAGGFRRAAGSPIAVGGMPLSVVVHDLNADGRLDVAVTNIYAEADGIAVFLGNGAGGLRPAVDSPFPVATPNQIAAADLNGDSRPDLALAGSGGVRVMLRAGSRPVIVRGRIVRGRPNRVFVTRGLITKLAADGNRVAVRTTAASSRSCGRVVVWTAPGRASKSFSTSNPGCGSILCSRGSGCVDEVAVGAGQVAWIARSGGNNLELMVITARLSGGKPKLVDYVTNGFGAGGSLIGSWVGHLLGGGSVLAYNGWRLVCNAPEEEGCGGTRDPRWRVTDERLVRLEGSRRIAVKRGAGSRSLRAVGGGRMAVETEGAVLVLVADGRRVATIPAVPGNPPRGIALSRTRLALMRTFTLDLHSPSTGARKRSISLGPAAGLQLVGVNSRLAMLRGPRRVVLVRLSDGRLISLPITPTRAASIVDARLTEAGLFYAHNVLRPAKRGRITFEPTAKLLARF